MSREY